MLVVVVGTRAERFGVVFGGYGYPLSSSPLLSRLLARFISPVFGVFGSQGFTFVARLGTAIVMVLAFSSISICAQTATPPAAATALGSVAVGTATAQTAVTFSLGSGGTLGAPLVLTQGTPNLDFQLGSGSTCTSPTSGGSCTVNVVFKPIAPGLRRGAVELTNSAGGVIATAFIFGNGIGPRVITPGVISTLSEICTSQIRETRLSER